MTKFTTAFLVFAVGSLGGCAMGESDVAATGANIIGGIPDSTHDAVVAVVGPSGTCTGTVIFVDPSSSTGVVLTAAQCVTAMPTAIVAGYDYMEAGATTYTPTDIRPHPDYSGGTDANIALIRFTGATGATLSLAYPSTDNLMAGDFFEVVGFGWTAPGGPDQSMRYAVSGTVDTVLAQTFVATPGPCRGDEGAPALGYSGGTETVLGVTADFPTDCSVVTYTRVAVYHDFIQSYLDEPPPDGGVDAGTPDTGTPDTGAPDAGWPDGGTPDSGAPDADLPDGGMADTSVRPDTSPGPEVSDGGCNCRAAGEAPKRAPVSSWLVAFGLGVLLVRSARGRRR